MRNLLVPPVDRWIFTKSPAVRIASNTFINVPVILQYEDTPLIEVAQTVSAGYTTRFQIYNQDGVYLAKVDGSRLFLADAGRKSGLFLEYPDHMTVCKLAGKILFEISRQEAAALRTSAELYTPDGRFVRCNESSPPSLFQLDGSGLKIGGVYLGGNILHGCRIGILIRKDGSFAISSNGPPTPDNR